MLTRRLLWLLALTNGITVASIYYAQPLLHAIGRSLAVSQSAAGLLVTAAQVGFAVGLLLVVPLGDIAPRRPLISGLLAADAVALAASAAAPGLRALIALAVLIGTATVVVQMIIPYAATLARDDQRAGTLGALLGAILVGILLSRTFAGVLASLVGWRGVYGVAAGLMAVTALVVYRMLPAGGREVGIGFPAQLRAVLRLAAGQPVLRLRAVIGAAQFAAFSCFWTTVTFLLAGPAYRYSQAQIGLFALVGAAGAGSALFGGRLLDRYRGLRWPATGVVVTLLIASFGLLAAGAHGLVWLVLGALLMDACSQGVHLSNQAVIYDLVDGARARVTTVYMTVYFLGGALGTTLGTAEYVRHGWGGACATAAGFGAVALLAWLAAYRHERLTQSSSRSGSTATGTSPARPDRSAA